MKASQASIQLRTSPAFVASRPRYPARNARGVLRVCASATQSVSLPLKDYGVSSLQGVTRKQNEDRYDFMAASEFPGPGEPLVYAGVFDGHGGNAVSDWLANKLYGVIKDNWQGGGLAERSLNEAFLQADVSLLKPQGGFFGMGERGVGGSKCGATGAVVLIYQDSSGELKLVTANCGDARILLVRDGKAIQLTEDHVPDNEVERKRIEASNPNPRMPLVRFVGDTWRVGGLLALSRAFGDAYLKGSLQFEGVQERGNDGYSSGFGVIVEPHTTLTTLTGQDSWIVVCSDGLFANEERGGGGGLENAEVAKMCLAAKGDCTALTKQLCRSAVDAGSTDDVTVLVLKLDIPAAAAK